MQVDYLYHVTRLTNLKSILKHGLKPNQPRVPNTIKGVYLTKNPYKWVYWISKFNTLPTAILKINTKGLELTKNNTKYYETNDLGKLVETWDNAEKDYIHTSTLPTKRIISVHTSSKSQLNYFKLGRRA